MAYLADNLPMKRMGQPQDIAHACLFLADTELGLCLWRMFRSVWWW